jgi:hypothetical protein
MHVYRQSVRLGDKLLETHDQQFFNVECYARVQMDEAVSDTERNTCATSYVTADNSRPMAYLILKVICK